MCFKKLVLNVCSLLVALNENGKLLNLVKTRMVEALHSFRLLIIIMHHLLFLFIILIINYKTESYRILSQN